ncbi:MAG: glycoside hydrolase family 113 [Armatimonadota bacterium]
MRHPAWLRLICCMSILFVWTQVYAAQKPRSSSAKLKGANYVCYYNGGYASWQSEQALQRLADDGVNFLAVTVTAYQPTYTSTIIAAQPWTPSDADLRFVTDRAHALGMRVMLKPAVDLSQDPYHWRGDIGSGFTSETEWQTWFSAYTSFITYYAKLAKSIRADMLCVGAELCGTTHRAAEWRKVVAGLRRQNRIPLTYASNWGGEESGISWWDALDYIGVNAYYPVSDSASPTVESMVDAWISYGYLQTLANLSAAFKRPVLLTEIGYRSIDGATMAPWDWCSTGEIDLQEQADAYQAAFEALWRCSWLAGTFWWYADVNPAVGGADDPSYSFYEKPAEAVLRQYYRGN